MSKFLFSFAVIVFSSNSVLAGPSVCDAQVDKVIQALALVDETISIDPRYSTYLEGQIFVPGDEGEEMPAEKFDRRIGGLLNIEVVLLPESKCRVHSLRVYPGSTD